MAITERSKLNDYTLEFCVQMSSIIPLSSVASVFSERNAIFRFLAAREIGRVPKKMALAQFLARPEIGKLLFALATQATIPSVFRPFAERKKTRDLHIILSRPIPTGFAHDFSPALL